MSTANQDMNTNIMDGGSGGPKVKILLRNYDFLAPLASGDVNAEGLNLALVRDNPSALPATLSDPQYDGGELSLGHHLLRLSNNDRSFIGIPTFVHRGFRHRCFFAARNHEIGGLDDLAGKRVGADKWSTTGNTWQRAAILERGVDFSSVSWWVGSLDGSSPAGESQSALPEFVNWTDRPLMEMLAEGELDVIMSAFPPPGFDDPNGPLVRLFPDFRKVEEDYYHRSQMYPGHHILGVRRSVYEENPWVLKSLFNALSESRSRAYQNLQTMGDFTPWILAELEETSRILGSDWGADGFAENRKMVEKLIEQQVTQGLLSTSMTPEEVFEEFIEVMQA